MVDRPVTLPAGFLGIGTSQKTLSDARRACDQEIGMTLNPLAIGQGHGLAPFQPSGPMEVEVLQAGRVGESLPL